MFVLRKLVEYINLNDVELNDLVIGYSLYSDDYEDYTYSMFTKESSITQEYTRCYPGFYKKGSKLEIEVGDCLTVEFKVNKLTRVPSLYMYHYYEGDKSEIKLYIHGPTYKIFKSDVLIDDEKFNYETIYRNDRLKLIKINARPEYSYILPNGTVYQSGYARIHLYFNFYREIVKIKIKNQKEFYFKTYKRYIPFPV
jgi:hypothetical protein